MILTVTPNPCVDKTVFIESLVPGGRFRSDRCACVPGGKGSNVSRAVRALGGATKALVIVGGPAGRHVVDMIGGDDGVDCVPVWVAGMTRTITTVLESAVHRQTAFFEPGPAPTPEECRNALAVLEQAVRGAAVATFNGSVPAATLDGFYHDGILAAKAAGALTVLDSYGEVFRRALPAAPHMIKPNREEAEGLLGFALDTMAARWRAVDAFHAMGVALVALSLGAEGALVSRAGERLIVRPPKINEVNPVGSGDALVAGFALGLERNMPLADMARLGVAAGTANALSWDIGHFTPEEVDRVARDVAVERVD